MARMATFDDFTTQTYLFDIESPAGDLLTVELRALTPGERMALEFSRNKRPVPPQNHQAPFHKIGETVYPVRDEFDEGFRREFSDWQERQIKLMIIASVVSPAIPGETDDEQIAALDRMAAWARAGLWVATQRLLTVGEDQVKRRSFRPVGSADDADLSGERLDGGTVPEPIDSGA